MTCDIILNVLTLYQLVVSSVHEQNHLHVTLCRLYSQTSEAAVSWTFSDQQLVSSLMLFCQRHFGCLCLSNPSLQNSICKTNGQI